MIDCDNINIEDSNSDDEEVEVMEVEVDEVEEIDKTYDNFLYIKKFLMFWLWYKRFMYWSDYLMLPHVI